MIGASVPPARTTSAWPRRIDAAASPIAVEPVAQAETGAKFWPPKPELDRDLPARRVDEDGGDEERRHAIVAALGEHLLLLGDRRDASDRGADEDPDPGRVHVLEPRVVPGLLGGGDGEQHVPIHAPRLLRREEVAHVEPPHLRRDPHGVLGRVERLDPADTAPARDRGLPRRRCVEPDRRDGSETGDDDPAHGAESLLGGAAAGHDDGQRARPGRTALPRVAREGSGVPDRRVRSV